MREFIQTINEYPGTSACIGMFILFGVGMIADAIRSLKE